MFRLSKAGSKKTDGTASADGNDMPETGVDAPAIDGTGAQPVFGAQQMAARPASQPTPHSPPQSVSLPEPGTEALSTNDNDPALTEPRVQTRPSPVSRPRTGGIALALGGGAARGWAHIGVLKALDEAGVKVSMIAGTSIGALVGGCYLAGVLDELEEFSLSLTKSNMLRYMDFTLRGSGLISGAKLASRMDNHMSEIMIEDMKMPFVAVATDISTGHEIWLHDGPLIPALRASYALPGVFTPIQHNGRHLVDGALVNPVPVSACRAYEPDVVIAVNLNSETFGRGTVIRGSHYDNPENESFFSEATSSWFPFLRSEDHATYKKNRLGVTTVMMEAFNIIQDRISRARLAGDPPDYTIRPKLKKVGLAEFHKAAESIELGYEEMTHRLRELENQGALEGLKTRETV